MDALALLVPILFWGPFVAYLLLQVYGAITFERWWRAAALLPILVMVPVVIATIIDYNAQSNLWPILLI
jgi:hypothetical protein